MSRKRLQELAGIKYNEESLWAFLIETENDWEIIAPILESKNYKFISGYTFSSYTPIQLKPFVDDENRPARDENPTSILTYLHYMSFEGFTDGFVVMSKPKKKLQLVNKQTFISRKNSTYREYTLYSNLTDLIRIL